MKLIGLTGGIGSGKSTVSEIFKTLGIPVYVSDERAKSLMHSDPQLRSRIIALLGAEAYLPSGEINRAWIASRAFKDRSLLQNLNSLVHPAVRQDVIRWKDSDDIRSAAYWIKESALLFEENLTEELDAVILVTAPEAIRIERVIRRDHVTEAQVRERMQHQWPDDRKIPLADFILFNDGQRSLIDQVNEIDRMIRFENKA